MSESSLDMEALLTTFEEELLAREREPTFCLIEMRNSVSPTYSRIPREVKEPTPSVATVNNPIRRRHAPL